jgi:hypothetical protein
MQPTVAATNSQFGVNAETFWFGKGGPKAASSLFPVPTNRPGAGADLTKLAVSFRFIGQSPGKQFGGKAE